MSFESWRGLKEKNAFCILKKHVLYYFSSSSFFITPLSMQFKGELQCNQKERVRKHTAQRLLSTNPGAHACLNHSTQLRPPKMYTSLTVCWILTRSKTRKSFAPTHPQSRFHNMCPLTCSFTHSSTKRGTFSLHCRLTYIPKA